MPQKLDRYNTYRNASINITPADGFSSGDVMQEVEQIVADVLPSGYVLEWTGTAQQERESAGYVVLIFSLSLLFAYLFLVAQ